MDKILDEIKRDRIKTYYTVPIDLSVARNNEEYGMVGTSIYVMSVTGLFPAAQIRLNEISNDAIDLLQYRRVHSPFWRFFITNVAQTGFVINLAIGVESDKFQLEDYPSSVNAYLSDVFLGTQVAKNNSAINQTTLIHTVSAGKNFVFDFFALGYECSVASFQYGYFCITDAADAIIYYVSYLSISTIANFLLAGNPSIIIPEGYKLKLVGSTSMTVRGFIKGREINK